MTATTTEIDDYVTAVHAALADLPDSEREDLLDDLPQHLADVRADRTGSLVDLLGTPEAYAAELRATAGLDATPGMQPWWQSLRHRLATADERVGSAFGYERFADLVHALAPGWWVVRGWLIAEFVTGATGRSGRRAMVPAIGGNWVAGVVLLIVAVAASVWLGRRALLRSWQRTTVAVLGIAVALYGVALVRHAFEPTTYYVQSDNVDGNDVSGVSNVYPVAPDGTVLKGIRLFDQDGNPITLGFDCPEASYGSGLQTFQVDGVPSDATSAPSYPLTCPADAGPFPSGTAPALPATSSPAPAASATPSSGSPTPSAPVTPTSARPAPTPTR